MSQISHLYLDKKVESRVYEVFVECIANASTSTSVNKLIADLLSPTERLMLAKRLSIALLLIKKYDQRSISNWLKVSLGTVSKVSLVLQKGSGGYAQIIHTVLKKEELQELIRKVDDALSQILPPLSRDWKSYRRNQWEEKINDHKVF
jgi:uncharacterized protein YerC